MFESPKRTSGCEQKEPTVDEMRRAFEAHLQRLKAEIASTNADMAAVLEGLEIAHPSGQMHAEIRRYSGHGADALFDLLEEFRDEVAALMRTIPSFVSYSLFRTADGGAAFTVCGDKSGIDQSARVAHDWIAHNAAEIGACAPELTEGRIVVHVTRGTPPH